MKRTILLAIALLPLYLFAQTQLGESILGEIAEGLLGHAVALSEDGSRLAVGAPLVDGIEPNEGRVYVYEYQNGAWEQLGEIIFSTKVLWLGWSLSFSADGNRLAVGAPGTNHNGYRRGEARVYEWDGTAWETLGAPIKGAFDESQLAYDVKLSADGNTLAIGIPFDPVNGQEAGSVQVYQWVDVDWSQVGETIYGQMAGEKFGLSVDVSADGTTIAAGAPSGFEAEPISGRVRVYRFFNGQWLQLGTDLNGKGPDDRFGTAIALSNKGDRLVIGCPSFAFSLNGVLNFAQVYEYEAGAWAQLGDDLHPEPYFGGQSFGISVDMNANGSRVIVGASFPDSGVDEDGEVHVFDLSADQSYELTYTLPGIYPGEGFGSSVAISSDGNTLAVGANRNNQIAAQAGHTAVFQLPGMTTSTFGPELVSNATFDLAPNPGSHYFTINAALSAPHRLAIWNSHGQLMKKRLYHPGQYLNTESLPNGMYLIQLSSLDGVPVGSARWVKNAH